MRLTAPAKLNLALEVLGRRSDGFHELCTVFQAISLADTLEVRPCSSLRLEAPAGLGPPEQNLALRAARLLRARFGRTGGAQLLLRKRIPVGAGLGGGSSDAAAALRLLALRWRLPVRASQLGPLAAELGSDVPFFLGPPTALARGRGERLQPLPPLRQVWFVLVVPPWSVDRKTARVFAVLTAAEYSSGGTVERLAGSLRRGGRPANEDFANGLAAAAARVFPELAALQQRLESRTGARFSLSGAGPALFTLAESPEAAAACAAACRSEPAAVYLARPLTRQPRPRRLEHGAGEPAVDR